MSRSLVEKYNDRTEQDILRSEVLEEFTDEIIDLYHAIQKEKEFFRTHSSALFGPACFISYT